LLNAGRFGFVWMGQWNEIREDWDALAEFGPISALTIQR
jgi:hypothetical protein